MDNGQVIGIDLGGTAIKLARFDHRGTLLAELEVATPQPAVPTPTARGANPTARGAKPVGNHDFQHCFWHCIEVICF